VAEVVPGPGQVRVCGLRSAPTATAALAARAGASCIGLLLLLQALRCHAGQAFAQHWLLEAGNCMVFAVTAAAPHACWPAAAAGSRRCMATQAPCRCLLALTCTSSTGARCSAWRSGEASWQQQQQQQQLIHSCWITQTQARIAVLTT
jgi:hypothetical protein